MEKNDENLKDFELKLTFGNNCEAVFDTTTGKLTVNNSQPMSKESAENVAKWFGMVVSLM